MTWQNFPELEISVLGSEVKKVDFKQAKGRKLPIIFHKTPNSIMKITAPPTIFGSNFHSQLPDVTGFITGIYKHQSMGTSLEFTFIKLGSESGILEFGV